MTRARYIAMVELNHDERHYEIGEDVELDASAARPLLAIRAIVLPASEEERLGREIDIVGRGGRAHRRER